MAAPGPCLFYYWPDPYPRIGPRLYLLSSSLLYARPPNDTSNTSGTPTANKIRTAHILQAGETERAMDYLRYYSRRRLLGEHVPYPVEAYPEGNHGYQRTGMKWH